LPVELLAKNFGLMFNERDTLQAQVITIGELVINVETLNILTKLSMMIL